MCHTYLPFNRIFPIQNGKKFSISILLFSWIILFFSSSEINSSFLNSAEAQTCSNNLPIISVSAIGNDGNVPGNVLDNNLNTRWSNLGVGSWILADLGSTNTICSVDIAWYLGNQRTSNFVIATSTDGTTFTNVFSGTSSGTTLNSEMYSFGSTSARYVRVTVNGNSQNNWASITELNIFGSSSPPPPPSDCTTNLPISGITASGNEVGNVPSNVLDGSLSTRWASNGIGQFISADLGSTKNICSVDIAWHNGNARVYHFVIATSTDGTTFTTKFSGDSSGTTLNSENYVFSDTNARYVRVTVNGNSQNNWASITELDIFGSSGSSNSPPVANNQAVTTNKNTAKSITLTATDPDNNPLTYAIVTQPTHGTVTGGTGASRTYTPTTGYVGSDSFTFKANDGTVDSNTASVSITVQEPTQGGSYNYSPSLALTGSNFQDVASSSSLQLSQFSVAAWFKTSSNFGSDAFIVNKGGAGSDSSGQNLNYGIWMTSSEQIKAGFETSSGADQYVTSVNT
ncbi:MAG TPA: discoidin domain-containing protein, partial [Nitrososphaeraceae archaeon]|nr:discoidin domain-containing protein [Nitrososphaeraceae archaeon]